jgi:hypothetical protein
MAPIVSMKTINRDFNRVRLELQDVGLLAPARYLDRIECYQSVLPSFCSEMGYVFDTVVPWYVRLVGFEAGMIYLPLNPPIAAWVPGGTLVDTIRHEFAHSWAWLDPRHVDGPWFRKAFGARYGDTWDPDREPEEFDADEYVSSYAMTAPCEDFAETFMTWLRCRNSLDRFRNRPGVTRKLRAVGAAVKVAAQERVHRIRGPIA